MSNYLVIGDRRELKHPGLSNNQYTVYTGAIGRVTEVVNAEKCTVHNLRTNETRSISFEIPKLQIQEPQNQPTLDVIVKDLCQDLKLIDLIAQLPEVRITQYSFTGFSPVSLGVNSEKLDQFYVYVVKYGGIEYLYSNTCGLAGSQNLFYLPFHTLGDFRYAYGQEYHKIKITKLVSRRYKRGTLVSK